MRTTRSQGAQVRTFHAHDAARSTGGAPSVASPVTVCYMLSGALSLQGWLVTQAVRGPVQFLWRVRVRGPDPALTLPFVHPVCASASRDIPHR